MGSNYKQLTYRDRLLLENLRNHKKPVKEMAKILGFHQSTIYREIKRNHNIFLLRGWYRYYESYFANEKARKRKYKRPHKLSSSPELHQYVISRLKRGWSPNQISGRLNYECSKERISEESIYRYIYHANNRLMEYYKYLRRKHKIRFKKGVRKTRKVPESILIKNRPKNIAERSEYGHWEGDLMIFSKGINSNLITLRERKSRFFIAIKNLTKQAVPTASKIINRLNKYNPIVKSITFDQGSEFFQYDWIKSCLETEVFFCEPRSPYHKGAIENGNSVIRYELPRNRNIDLYSQNKIDTIVDEINRRPMKCLGYKSPHEVFMSLRANEI